MTTRQGDADALVRRVEDAGIPVTRGRQGYKVHMPKGMFPIHRTYSDRRSLTNATKALERMGLTEAEERMATLKEQARAEMRAALAEPPATPRRPGTVGAEVRITEPRSTSEDKDVRTTTPKKATAALAKAVGPYMVEPEDVPATWFATPHPAMWPRYVNITPELATYLLDNFNDDNRTIRDARVEHYRDIIVSKQWHTTHQGIAMDTRPMLQDGQHRLLAVVEASSVVPDLKVPFVFFVGMPEENYKAIDENLLRSAADMFTKGETRESYGSTIGTVIRLSAAFQDQNPRRLMRQRTTNERIVDFWETDKDELRLAARFGVANFRKSYATSGPLGASYYLLRKKNGVNNRFVGAFFEGLVTGRKAGTRLALDETDPREVTRQYFQNIKMQRKRLNGIEQLAIIVMAWNNIVTHRQPRNVKFGDDSDIPRIIVCEDTGPNASACPVLLQGEVDEYDDEDDE